MAKVVKQNKSWVQIAKEDGAIAGFICLVISLGLLVASFVLPPKGVIDTTVLQGVAEVFAFATLFKLPAIIKTIQDGKSITLKKGEFEIGLNSKKDNIDLN